MRLPFGAATFLSFLIAFTPCVLAQNSTTKPKNSNETFVLNLGFSPAMQCRDGEVDQDTNVLQRNTSAHSFGNLVWNLPVIPDASGQPGFVQHAILSASKATWNAVGMSASFAYSLTAICSFHCTHSPRPGMAYSPQ